MNYSEVVLQSPRLDRADKSSRCSGRVFLFHRKWFSLSLTCFLLFFMFTATCWETSTQIYDLKLELSIQLLTLSPSLCRPPWGFSQVKSGLFRLLRKADGSLPTLPICLPSQAKPRCKQGKRILWKEKHWGLCTQSQCVNILSEAFPEMKAVSWDQRRGDRRFNKIAQRFYYHIPEMGQHEIKINFYSKVCSPNMWCICLKVPKCYNKN